MVSAMVIGPGRVNFSLRLVCARAACASIAWTRPFSRSGAGHDRHHRLVAVVADSHLDLVREIDAVDPLQKSVHEMLARLFAVADDVDAAIFLQLHRKDGGVALAFREFIALQPPGGPKLFGLCKPGRFRQAAGDGGLEHVPPDRRFIPGFDCTGSVRPPIIKPVVARAKLHSAEPAHRNVARQRGRA